uniref:Uncharacterized protein n=1 Tax=viral metagenome TaxID=1070528 RepID=A0A6C0JSS0_9ZZZZ
MSNSTLYRKAKYRLPSNFPYDALINGGTIYIDDERITIPPLSNDQIERLTGMLFGSWAEARIAVKFFIGSRQNAMTYFFSLDWYPFLVYKMIKILNNMINRSKK